MFGYLFMDKDKLTLTERKIFRDYYCSICLSIKYNYGNLMRLTLNYDIVYLAMMLDYGIEVCNCGKCGKYIDNAKQIFTNGYWKKIADYNMLLISQKIKDDIKDEGGLKNRIIAKFLLNKLIKKGVYGLYLAMEQELSAYYNIESSQLSIEQKIHIYADCMCDTVQLFFAVDKSRLDLLYIIFQIIVLLDAIDDFEYDKKRGRVTLLVEYLDKPLRMKAQLLRLARWLSEVSQLYYSRCHFGKKANIILRNLLYDYMPKLIEEIFTGNYVKEYRRIL